MFPQRSTEDRRDAIGRVFRCQSATVVSHSVVEPRVARQSAGHRSRPGSYPDMGREPPDAAANVAGDGAGVS